jgi:hypothetical protein
MTDARVAELLDELTPTYDDRTGDWERVTAAAHATSRRAIPTRTHLRLGLLLAAIGAAAALVLAWPFGSERGSVLGRALAAVGNGPVLHVVLRGEWGGTLIDLASGDRKPIYGDTEIWYDTERGLEHSIARLGGVVQDEELYEPNKPDAVLAALGREYRQALESGRARVTSEDTIASEPVVWLTIHSELLPDVADGNDHEWAQQVAVSKRTFKPFAVRETRDGRPGPETQQRVLDLELLPRVKGDFATSRPSRNGTAVKWGREPSSLEQAPAVLGRTPLWLGRAYDGLPLTRVYREIAGFGREEDGHMKWHDERPGVVFYYGTVGDDPSTSRQDSIPLFDKPYVDVTETTEPSPYRRAAGTYIPPEGSVFIAAGGQTGFLQRDGIQISIDAGTEMRILAAARALIPVAP